MRKTIFTITNIIYSLLLQLVIPVIIYIITDRFLWFIISIVIVYIITFVFLIIAGTYAASISQYGTEQEEIAKEEIVESSIEEDKSVDDRDLELVEAFKEEPLEEDSPTEILEETKAIDNIIPEENPKICLVNEPLKKQEVIENNEKTVDDLATKAVLEEVQKNEITEELVDNIKTEELVENHQTKPKVLDNKKEEDDDVLVNLEKINLNTDEKALVSLIREILNENGLQEVKIRYMPGVIMAMSLEGFVIDFNRMDNFYFNDDFEKEYFIYGIYHEIGHYKSGITRINLFLQFLATFSLSNMIGVLVKSKYRVLLSQGKMDFNLLFFRFLDGFWDMINLCRTLWLRNDESYANVFAREKGKFADLVRMFLFQEEPGEDILHPSKKQILKQGLSYLEPYQGIKGLYYLDGSIIFINNKKNNDKFEKLIIEDDPNAKYTMANIYRYGLLGRKRNIRKAIELYRDASVKGHELAKKCYEKLVK